MKVSTRLEGDLGEISVEDLFGVLKEKCKFQDNGVVVRLESDQEYWDLVVGINRQAQRAQNGASIVGGTIKLWAQNGIYAEGSGWRMILVPQEFQVGLAPGAGPPGPRLVRG